MLEKFRANVLKCPQYKSLKSGWAAGQFLLKDCFQGLVVGVDSAPFAINEIVKSFKSPY